MAMPQPREIDPERHGSRNRRNDRLKRLQTENAALRKKLERLRQALIAAQNATEKALLALDLTKLDLTQLCQKK